MSNRELKSLLAGRPTPNTQAKRSSRSGRLTDEMTDSPEEELTQLRTDLATAREEVQAKDHELSELRQEALEATSRVGATKEELRQLSLRVETLQKELENSRLVAEVDRLKSLERLREEHAEALARQKEELNYERRRAEEWMQDLKQSFQVDKERLQERIDSLEGSLTTRGSKEKGVARMSTERAPKEAESAPKGGPELTATAGDPTPSKTTEAGTETHDPVSEPITTTPTTEPETVTVTTEPITVPSVTESVTVTTPAEESTRTTTVMSSTGTGGVMPDGLPPGDASTDHTLIQTVTQLLQAQTQAMAAQARVAAAQNLPTLHPFTGEEDLNDDDVFERWLERFEERAKLTGWTEEQKLYQLKSHLAKTALQVFRVLPNSEQSKYDDAVRSLKKRFRSVDIEELRGLEFHQKTQGEETIEQLGIDLQKLSRKAFPTLKGKELDILLKGRFFQALHVKWQRKLNAPKPSETFSELYDRARMLERHEKQYAASAANRDSGRTESRRRELNKPQTKPQKPRTSQTQSGTRESTQGSSVPQRRIPYGVCYICEQDGHLARHCPTVKPKPKAEAQGRTRAETTSQGRSRTETTARNSAVESHEKPEQFTVAELEKLLSQRRLQEEQETLSKTSSSNSTVTTPETVNKAVGDTVYLDVLMEDVPVRAMVDTGAQSTIISRSMLHEIAHQSQADGRPPPTLSEPSVRLFGKDGKGGGRELIITAELKVTLKADGESVTVTVFVQPNSEQKCLLGMNAIPLLGISMSRINGEPLITNCASTVHANVCLVRATTIPSNSGRFVKAQVSTALPEGKGFMFEPKFESIDKLGLSVQGCLLTVASDKTIPIPIENFQGVPVTLEEGSELGTVTLYVPDDNHSSHVSASSESQCAHVTALENTPARLHKLIEALGLVESKLDPTQLKKLKSLIAECSDIFALDDSELGCTGLVQHEIDTNEHHPIKQQPYRTPFTQRAKISQMIDDMEKQGVVKPSSSPWASPIILVPKKDGTSRFCIDYRRLNAVTTKDVYPLPRIDDILDTLGKAKYFSSLDLASGYWQVELSPGARQKSAFTTHRGLFEFVRMPFGLCNAPATFQRLMQKVLAGLEWNSCFVYLDDILLASKTFDEHIQHLRAVFERLRQANLRLKPKKCKLLREEVNYLGHVISKQGIKPNPEKTEKVRSFPTPVDVTKVRQFLGLASYYRRFVPAFARIAAPLHFLTKKNVVFNWTHECEEAFSKLKASLTSAPVLSFPVFGPDTEFILETDASGVGLGAILSQEQTDGCVHPIAYASRSLDPHEKNYGISELETLALVWAVRYFRPYILGHHTTVYTDHAACRSLLDSNRPSGKLARWALTIQEMNLTIRHRAGKKHANADALSRISSVEEKGLNECAIHSNVMEDQLLSTQFSMTMANVREVQKKDPLLLPYLHYLEQNVVPEDEKQAKRVVLESKAYEMIDGVLHHENPNQPGRWCIVVPSEVQPELLQEAHAGCVAGHLSERKVYDRLRRTYWWQGMRSAVRRHCRSCLTCATRRGTGRRVHPPMQPIPVGGPFHRVGVDILKLPQTTSGNSYVVVFVDYLTKWPEAFALPDQKAQTIAQVFCEQIICRHGIPEQLLSDRGSNFLSELMLAICEILGVQKINTSGYHPQTDGLVEKFNSTLTNMIAKACAQRPFDWDQQLPFLLFAYRTSAQESTKEAPFYLLYGRDARIPTETVLDYQRSPYVVDTDDYKEELVRSLSDAWSSARENISEAQTRQKKFHDRKSSAPKIVVGDRVMVYMPKDSQGKNRKLARPYHGPYRVLSVTPTNVEVRLADKPKDDPIFISLDRVTLCYPELDDTSWDGHTRHRRKPRKSPSDRSLPGDPPHEHPYNTRSKATLV